MKQLISKIETEYEKGAPLQVVIDRAEVLGMDPGKVEHEIDKLYQKGEAYEPHEDWVRTT
nr:hypothetical protein [Halostagnicola sp. A56]